MEISRYLLTAVYTHYKRLAEHARVDSSDIRTLNALRLARKEIQQIRKLIEKENNERESLHRN